MNAPSSNVAPEFDTEDLTWAILAVAGFVWWITGSADTEPQAAPTSYEKPETIRQQSADRENPVESLTDRLTDIRGERAQTT